MLGSGVTSGLGPGLPLLYEPGRDPRVEVAGPGQRGARGVRPGCGCGLAAAAPPPLPPAEADVESTARRPQEAAAQRVGGAGPSRGPGGGDGSRATGGRIGRGEGRRPCSPPAPVGEGHEQRPDRERLAGAGERVPGV